MGNIVHKEWYSPWEILEDTQGRESKILAKVVWDKFKPLDAEVVNSKYWTDIVVLHKRWMKKHKCEKGGKALILISKLLEGGGWEEKLIRGKMYYRHTEKVELCPIKSSASAPPPYNIDNFEATNWTCRVCGVQNPKWREECYNCGAPRPRPPEITDPQTIYPQLNPVRTRSQDNKIEEMVKRDEEEIPEGAGPSPSKMIKTTYIHKHDEYKPWTPSEMMTLLQQLPDPMQKPMAFHRMLSQIQTTYEATRLDLQNLIKGKMGPGQYASLPDDILLEDERASKTRESGEQFVRAVGKWAKDQAAKKGRTLVGITQDPDETVHAFYGKLCVHASDLGYDDCPYEVRGPLVTEAFMQGLTSQIKEKLVVAAPDWRSRSMDSLLAKAEGIQLALPQKKIQPTKVMVVQEDDGRRRGEQKRSREIVCWYCGKKGHVQRQCRKARKDKDEGRWEPVTQAPNYGPSPRKDLPKLL